MTLVRFQHRSGRSSKKLNGKSSGTSPPTRRRSLGSKLQVLAGKSPDHLKIVETVVDLILKQLSLSEK